MDHPFTAVQDAPRAWAPFDVPAQNSLSERFRGHVAAESFPCVGSKAALARDAIRIHEFDSMQCPRSAARLLERIDAFGHFVDAQDPRDTTVHSLVAVFHQPRGTDEARFEALLWSLLQKLHDLDHARGQAWAPDVSTEPDDARFSLSLAGHPFFVIGLHPGASRIARRFEAPALVFNSHRQFEKLRGDGRYGKMQAATRQRDMALQGSLNPNLADFGSAAETRQYSGRAVEPDWRCPFHVRGATVH